MFGFSFGKLLVLVAVICFVWFGFKFLARVQQAGDGKPARPLGDFADKVRRAARSRGGRANPPVEDMVQCPKCGAYHPSGAEHDCTAG